MEAIKEKLIFLIGKGFLGTKLVSVFKEKGIKVITADIAGKVDYSLDVTDEQSMIYLFKDLDPDIVFWAGGMANVDYCETEKEKAFEVNVEGTRNIVDSCRAFNSKLVFFSTDYVFDGIKGNYLEKDKVNPLNFYGKTKVHGEKLVKDLDNYILARVSSLYGFNSKKDKKNFVCHTIDELKNNNEFLVANLINCPTLIDDVAEAIFIMLEKEFSGLFHVCGSEASSKYNLIRKVCDVFDLDFSLVKQVPLIKHWKAKRPLNSSLDITKIQLQGIKMSSIEEGLINMKKQMKL